MGNCGRKKIKVLTVAGHYLPGFKSGGILRSIENMINCLNDEFEFYIVTRDHDFGETNPYSDVKKSQWNMVGHASVRYLSKNECHFSTLRNIVNAAPKDLIHLNSFFDPLTVKILLGRRLGHISAKPTILSPRGEFAWASLRIKFLKKLIYILLAKSFLLFDQVIWHASSEQEKNDIAKVMGIDSKLIHVAKDIPQMFDQNLAPTTVPDDDGESGILRVIFLSRISREKNLDYAIRVLSQCKSNVLFDIYGIVEDERYWSKCQKLVAAAPPNVAISYRGPVARDSVVLKFSEYDLFFFPTGGENYGHVIAESLWAGTPVLTSRNTPWQELETKGLGWDVDLESPDVFVKVLEGLASMTWQQRNEARLEIVNIARQVLCNPADAEENKKLYMDAVDVPDREKA